MMGVLGKDNIVGAGMNSVFLNECDTTLFTAPRDGTIGKLVAYCSNPDAVAVGFKLAALTNVAGLPGVLLALSDEVDLPSGAPEAWREFPLSVPFAVTAGQGVHLGHFGYIGIGGSVSTSAKVAGFLPGGNVGSFFTSSTYPNITTITPTADTVEYSIYGVYNDVGAPYTSSPMKVVR